MAGEECLNTLNRRIIEGGVGEEQGERMELRIFNIQKHSCNRLKNRILSRIGENTIRYWRRETNKSICCSAYLRKFAARNSFWEKTLAERALRKN